MGQTQANQEIKGYRLDRLNEDLAALDIDNIKDPSIIKAAIIDKVPLLRHNKEGSFKILQYEITKQINGEKTSHTWDKFYNWVCLPAALALGAYVYLEEKKEAQHFDETFADYIPYPYLNVSNTVSF